MFRDSMLTSEVSRRLYGSVASLPIYDFHCHLPIEEIYDDRAFYSVGELMLAHDHYKWRLMRSFGVDERLITGSASWRDKFTAYAGCLEMAANNPVRDWTAMELEAYFDISEPLTALSAGRIYDKCEEMMRSGRYTARNFLRRSKVAVAATTDDPAGPLDYHKALSNDFEIKVIPTFRTDALFTFGKGYPKYMKRLSDISGMRIKGLNSLENALSARIEDFAEAGCVMSDIGIPFFPDRPGDKRLARRAFDRALEGKELSYDEKNELSGVLFRFLAGKYRENGFTMQIHTGVMRNVNTHLFENIGADCGGDCIGEAVRVTDLAKMLDAIELDGGLPETILYWLDRSVCERMITLAGSFRHVRCGSAWWFADNSDGITELLERLSLGGHIASFPGMVTDSRSFLSYVRHDYFRIVLCALLGKWVQTGRVSLENAERLALKLCAENAREMIG